MTGVCKKHKASSWGLLNNHRYLYKKALMLNAMESARARDRCQKMCFSVKRKSTDTHIESLVKNKLLKKMEQICESPLSQKPTHSEPWSSNATKPELSILDQKTLVTVLADRWEIDSGFSSEVSPPTSGRSSPCLSLCPTTVVALDCEMVGTGPGGRCSELARCSILDYHGNVLYDKYIKPCSPVTDYRTPWSGIRRCHLLNAIPFVQARDEVRPASLQSKTAD